MGEKEGSLAPPALVDAFPALFWEPLSLVTQPSRILANVLGGLEVGAETPGERGAPGQGEIATSSPGPYGSGTWVEVKLWVELGTKFPAEWAGLVTNSEPATVYPVGPNAVLLLVGGASSLFEDDGARSLFETTTVLELLALLGGYAPSRFDELELRK